MAFIDKKKVLKTFNEYVNKYDASNVMIALKIKHTYKVADLCERIARSLNLSEEDILFAWASGMLHDVGRFEQYTRYKTFSDYKSVDHAEFGADLLFTEDMLIKDYYDDRSKDSLMEVVIRQHNKFRMKEGLDDRTLMFCNILRDADKIDILRVNVETDLVELYGTSEEILYSSEITDEVMNQVRKHQAVDRAIIKTPADRYICHLALVFELVYKESWIITWEQGYLAKMLEFPATNPDTAALVKEIDREIQLFAKPMFNE